MHNSTYFDDIQHILVFSVLFCLKKKCWSPPSNLILQPTNAPGSLQNTVLDDPPRALVSCLPNDLAEDRLTPYPLQVEKNIILEEKIQVLQQRNEDLKARIDQNTVVTR